MYSQLQGENFIYWEMKAGSLGLLIKSYKNSANTSKVIKVKGSLRVIFRNNMKDVFGLNLNILSAQIIQKAFWINKGT